MGQYSLLVLENPLLDIQVQGDAALLDKYDLKDDDAILADPAKHARLYSDLTENYDAKFVAGGSAQNTARGAQYILPDESVVYFGGVGKDDFADKLRAEAEKAGIRTEYRIDNEAPTGRCGVIITGHNRSMCTQLGAANEYDLEHLKSKWSFVEKAEYFYVGGYHVTVCVPAMKALGEEAAKENKDPIDEILPYSDYVLGNGSEAEAWAKVHDLADLSVEEIAGKIAQLPKENTKRGRTVVITQGTDPTIVAVASADGSSVETKSYPVHKISKDKIEDTNGAGDAFAGGFIAGLVKGEKLDTAVDMGQWLAALSLTQLGPSFPYPKKTYSKA